MSSFGLKDSPDFDDWQVQQGEVLRSELSTTLEMLAQGYATHGDLESAITYARQELALDRLNEAAHAQLMRLYAWSGRRPAALQQYQECARMLQEQLGVAPQDSLIALRDAIRSGGLPRPASVAEDTVATPASSLPLPAPADLGLQTAQSPAVTVLQEKRIVTVLAAQVEPRPSSVNGLMREDEAALVQRFAGATEDILNRYGGHRTRVVGGSILVVFGAALTRESDPELAARAALEMRSEAAKLGLSLSAGISTGEVYAGRSDTAASEQPGLVGRAIDMALRLAAQAPPGGILLAEPTYRATRLAFAFTAMDLSASAGKPALAYRVESLLPQPEKVRGIEDLRATLTGRDDEFAKLRSALELAGQGRGQIVSIIGEAGVGKSRLVAELKDFALRAADPVVWLEGRCLEMGTPASYAPFLDMLRAHLRWIDQEDDARRRESILSSLQQIVGQEGAGPERYDEMGALICRLLSVPAADALEARLRRETPEQIRYRTFLAVRDFFQALARLQPVVMVFEDLHWADSLSLDLIGLLLEGLEASALLMICAYRPEQEHPVRHLAAIVERICRDSYTELHLRDLSQIQSRELLNALVMLEAIPTSLQNSILGRAQGNPFFIEEIVRALIDSGALYRERGRWRARAEIDSTIIPDSVQSVILSRVDRLSEDARRILQTAAVIGRLFRRPVLEAASKPSANLGSVLAELADRALVYQERTFPEVEYSFKHVLTQQAVYQNSLSSRRADTHRRVAAAIETLYSDNLADYCEQLAYHCEQGGQIEKAVDYLFTAGEKAKRQYANTAAVAHLIRALICSRRCPKAGSAPTESSIC